MGYDIILLLSVLVLVYTHGIGGDGASGLCGKVSLMSEVSPTPGPWPITKGAYGALHVGPAVLAHPGKARIEYAADRGHDLLAQRDADARLIHAAHDMRAILQDLTTVWDAYERDGPVPLDQIIQRARFMLARVEGGAA
ncbi:MAG: hypothetical protein ACK5VI_09320 [Opitutia bacterium]